MYVKVGNRIVAVRVRTLDRKVEENDPDNLMEDQSGDLQGVRCRGCGMSSIGERCTRCNTPM